MDRCEPVGECLKLQGRFACLNEVHIAQMQAFGDTRLTASGKQAQILVPIPCEAWFICPGRGDARRRAATPCFPITGGRYAL